MRLIQSHGGDPEMNRDKIREWHARKGKALETERNARRADTRPARDAARAEMREQRGKRIDSDQASGRIGPKEAELMRLLNNRDKNPEAGQDALRKWHQQNGKSLKAEKEQLRRQK